MKFCIRSFFNNKINIIGSTILFTLIVGFADIITTSQYRLFFFYSIPIIVSSLYFSMYYSLFLSCLSILFILASSLIDHGDLHVYHFWNVGMMLVIFISITYLTKSLSNKRIIENEKIFLEEKNRILADSLNEKEMMIRETHHRIKNNLASLSSLISLTEAADNDALALKLNNRIQTFSVLYEKLSYSEENVSGIQLNEYLEGIIDLIIQNYDIPRNAIEVGIAGGDFHVHSKPASLIGLIINELATNSIRHGFKDMQDTVKTITLEFSMRGDLLIMRYSDNGPGFDYNNLPPAERHLGVHLLDSISKQLEGEVRHDGGRSSGFTFTFNHIDSIMRAN